MAARRGPIGARRRLAQRYYTPLLAAGNRLGVLADGGSLEIPIDGGNILGVMADGGSLNEAIFGGDILGRLRDGGNLPVIIAGGDALGALGDGGDFILPVVESGDVLGALADGGDVFIGLIDGGSALAELLDGGLQAQADVSSYSVYALNTITGAAAEYTHFELELMQIGEVMFAVGESGLFTLGAENDDGANIDAVVRTGFYDFDSDSLKRLPSVRFGASGAPLLKVRWIGRDDTLTESAYTPPSLPASATNTRVVPTGRGIKFTYAGIEIYNSSGADFEIDHIDMYPTVLNRRK